MLQSATLQPDPARAQAQGCRGFPTYINAPLLSFSLGFPPSSIWTAYHSGEKPKIRDCSWSTDPLPYNYYQVHLGPVERIRQPLPHKTGSARAKLRRHSSSIIRNNSECTAELSYLKARIGNQKQEPQEVCCQIQIIST